MLAVLLFWFPLPAAFGQDSLHAVRLFVMRDGQNITRDCSVSLYRNNKSERLVLSADSAGQHSFVFDARQNEAVNAEITYGHLGTMKTLLKCRSKEVTGEFLKPSEPYFYAINRKQLLVSDSCKYRFSDEINGYKWDTVLKWMRRTGISFRVVGRGDLQFRSEADAVKVERVLLGLSSPIRLEPKIVNTNFFYGEVYLTNKVVVTFEKGTSDEWIRKLFEKYGVKDYSKSEFYADHPVQEYHIRFIHAADRGYNRILDDWWKLKQVVTIGQVMHAPEYPD